NGSTASGTKHWIERSLIRSRTAAAKRTGLRWIRSSSLTVSAGGAVGVGKVGVVENVERLDAELRPEAFSKFEVLADRQIDIVEAGVAEDVAPHVAKGTKTVRDQHRVIHHVAVSRGVKRGQNIRTKSACRDRASSRNGSRARRIGP